MSKEMVKDCKNCLNGMYNDHYGTYFCYAIDDCVDWNLWVLNDKMYKEQELCEDCVSRIDVKEQMLKYGFHAPDMTVTEFIEDCLSPVTPKPKTGYWIIHEPFDNGQRNCNECIECSKCHQWFGHDSYAKTPYCPNCGAKMEELNDSN